LNADAAAIEGLHRMGGDRLVKGIIALFFEHVPTRVATIHSGVEGRDLEIVRRGAHALKSTAASLGLTRLSELSMGLELAAEKGDTGEVTRLAAQLDDLHEAARRYLAQFVASD
jgi:HPt (histidine-containing phosphotransfer) domain-containing protein